MHDELYRWMSHVMWVCQKDGDWLDEPAVYVFAKRDRKGDVWTPLYIGQADNICDRMADHERWDEAVRHGATHVHAMVVSEQADRDRIEVALIAKYQPQLNTHHR